MKSDINWTLSKILAYIVFLANAVFSFSLVYLASTEDPVINMKLIELAIASMGSGSMWAAILMGAKSAAQSYQARTSYETSDRLRG